MTKNTPRFDDLEGLAIGDISALPAEMLLDLQTAAIAEAARVKRLRDRLDAGIERRYEAAAAAERRSQRKTSGTVRVHDGRVVVISDLPKKVTWDQLSLAKMAERIRAAGDDPMEYMDISYSVPERKYSAWPESVRQSFATARSETTGKPTFKLSLAD